MATIYADNSNSRSANGTFPPGFEGMEAARELRIERGSECPDCGSAHTESNGDTEYRCTECDHRWGREGGRTGERYGY